ncbi:MAG: glycosyl hydrolase family 17 protein [Halioglobus sp.]
MSANSVQLELGNAICYSGYRLGQSPQDGSFPSYAQISEDLRILATNWKFLRLYDCSPHAEIVLAVIRDEAMDFKVMLGANMFAEVSNAHCPWGALYSEDILRENRQANSAEIDRMIALATEYPNIVFSVSVGNEATVEWTDHLVPVPSLIAYVHRIKSAIKQPVTFCENYVPWVNTIKPLAAELDFISLHTYPVWEYKSVDVALEYTKQNYYSVADQYPNKPVIITEAGWTTASNGRGIEPGNASQALQAVYYRELLNWTKEAGVITFVFEAFDEPWKGSPDPLEPEKHWGLFTVDRKPKLVMQELYADLLSKKENGER